MGHEPKKSFGVLMAGDEPPKSPNNRVDGLTADFDESKVGFVVPDSDNGPKDGVGEAPETDIELPPNGEAGLLEVSTLSLVINKPPVAVAK